MFDKGDVNWCMMGKAYFFEQGIFVTNRAVLFLHRRRLIFRVCNFKVIQKLSHLYWTVAHSFALWLI